jgi:hypothetical protein
MGMVFQYGSNATSSRLLGPRRLRGHGHVLGAAETIGDYDIAFDVWSQTNQCAASDLVVTPNRKAWGILYDIPDEFIRGKRPDGQKTLSQIEGPSYEETEIEVRPPGGQPVRAVTFLVRGDKRAVGLFTGAWYVSWIIYGLREHGVPEAYLDHVVEIALETNRLAKAASETQNALISSL